MTSMVLGGLNARVPNTKYERTLKSLPILPTWCILWSFLFSSLVPLLGVFPLFIYYNSFASCVNYVGEESTKNPMNIVITSYEDLGLRTLLVLYYGIVSYGFKQMFFFSSCWLEVHRLCNVSNNACASGSFSLWEFGILHNLVMRFLCIYPYIFQVTIEILFWAFWQISDPNSLCSSDADRPNFFLMSLFYPLNHHSL
jgi:hypothetical protein